MLIANKKMQIFSTLLHNRKCKSKAQWETNSHPPGRLKSKRQTITNTVENLEELELIHLLIAGAIYNGENCFLGSQNVKHRVTTQLGNSYLLHLPNRNKSLCPHKNLYKNNIIMIQISLESRDKTCQLRHPVDQPTPSKISSLLTVHKWGQSSTRRS